MDFDFALSTSWSDMDIGSKSAWAKELETRGYDVAIITPSEDVPDDAASAVFRLPELTTERSISFEDVEERYNIPSLRHLQTTEREYFALSRTEARERTRRLLTAFETIFSEHSFEYCVQGRGGELHRLLLHYYVNATGGTSVWQGFAFFEETFSLHTDLKGTWDTYETVPYEEIPEEDREWAEGYVTEFRNRRKFFTLADHDGDSPGVLVRMRDLVNRIDERVVRRRQPGDPFALGRKSLLRVSNAVANRRIAHSVESSKRRCERARYVLYPVQFPAESRLTVFSPQFHDQQALVGYLGSILPEGVDLFVKPHPHHPGEQSALWTYRLSRRPGVEVLHPEIHSHNVIEGAEAVVSVNNTPGFESILYGTPLLSLGSAFYSGTPGAHSVEPLSDLPEALADVVGSEIPHERIVESVYSLRRAAYDGDVGSADPADAAECVDSVLEFCQKSD